MRKALIITGLILILLTIILKNSLLNNEAPIIQEKDPIEDTSLLDSSWILFQDSVKDVQFYIPDNWHVSQKEDLHCNPYIETPSYCIDIENTEENSLIRVKFQKTNSEVYDFRIRDNEYRNAKTINIDINNKMSLLRPSTFNGIYDYFDKKNINLIFITELFENPKIDSAAYYGEGGYLLDLGDNNLSITYLISPNYSLNINDFDNDGLIKVMDQIISTFSIK